MIYNRNFKTKEYWIFTPHGLWWDGRSCVDIGKGRFIKGRCKGYSSNIICKPEELDKHLRIARTANLRSGKSSTLSFSKIERLTYRHNKRNRFFTDYWVGGIYIRKYPL